MTQKGKGINPLARKYSCRCSYQYTRLQLLVALGYKIDGVILAACVLFAMYFGDFIHVIAPVDVM